jgi:predicted AAA+ superfamily ATPase
MAIQVTVALQSPESYQREIQGLIAALQKNQLTEGLILSENEEKSLSINGIKIQISPIWRWLLDNG